MQYANQLIDVHTVERKIIQHIYLPLANLNIKLAIRLYSIFDTETIFYSPRDGVVNLFKDKQLWYRQTAGISMKPTNFRVTNY